jgi:hypothetical protein
MEAGMETLRMVALASLSVSLLAFSPPAFAASPSQESCEASGGTFTKEGGDVQCVTSTTDNVGNAPANSNSQTTTTTTTTTGQGNIENKQQTELNCSGPPGQQDPGCP